MPHIQQGSLCGKPAPSRNLASKHKFANQHYMNTRATYSIPSKESSKPSYEKQHPNLPISATTTVEAGQQEIPTIQSGEAQQITACEEINHEPPNPKAGQPKHINQPKATHAMY
jgi:hypothetical protein